MGNHYHFLESIQMFITIQKHLQHQSNKVVATTLNRNVLVNQISLDPSFNSYHGLPLDI